MLASRAKVLEFKTGQTRFDWIPPETLTNFIREFAWWLFEEYKDQKFTVRIWIFRKTLKLEDLRDVFILLFGPQPIGQSA